MDKAKRVSKEWGDKPCNHPEERIDSETIQVTKTEDYNCRQCGRSFMSLKEVERARKNPN